MRSKIGWDCPDSKWFRSGLNEILNYYVNDCDSGFFDKKSPEKYINPTLIKLNIISVT